MCVCVFVCLFVCLIVCLFVCLFALNTVSAFCVFNRKQTNKQTNN